jgi:acyl carrier protein
VGTPDTPSADEILDLVKGHLLDEVLPGEDPSRLTATTGLISGGILDSISRLRLVDFLERTFAIELEAHEVDVEHMETMAAVVSLVQAKLARKRPSPQDSPE